MTFRQLFLHVRQQSEERDFFDTAWPYLAQTIGDMKGCPPDWLDQEVRLYTANLCYGCAVATFIKVAAQQAASPQDAAYQKVAALAEMVRQGLNDACGEELDPIAILPYEQMVRMASLAKTLRGVDRALLDKLDDLDAAFERSLREKKPRKRGR